MAKDSVPPSLGVLQPSISLTISNSDTLIEDQGYTYNQAGFTYNQAGVLYGGEYNQNTDIIPIINIAQSVIPSLNINTTTALIEDQGYTYNQAGFSYDEPGVAYGGLYNQNKDVIPLILTASQIIPSIAGYADLYKPFVPPSGNSGMLIGILGLTYP